VVEILVDVDSHAISRARITVAELRAEAKGRLCRHVKVACPAQERDRESRSYAWRWVIGLSASKYHCA
jgi:hypothetical protein